MIHISSYRTFGWTFISIRTQRLWGKITLSGRTFYYMKNSIPFFCLRRVEAGHFLMLCQCPAEILEQIFKWSFFHFRAIRMRTAFTQKIPVLYNSPRSACFWWFGGTRAEQKQRKFNRISPDFNKQQFRTRTKLLSSSSSSSSNASLLIQSTLWRCSAEVFRDEYKSISLRLLSNVYYYQDKCRRVRD